MLAFWISLGSFLWSSVNAACRFCAYILGRPRIRLPAFVVTIGNLQVGGAGKTPLVAEIARQAVARGLSVCILLRGYRGRWEKTGGFLVPGDCAFVEDAGDEAVLLHELCPQAYLGIGANRIHAFENLKLKTQRSWDLILLDDGFQDHQIIKDLNILAWTNWQPHQKLFRDFQRMCQKADLLVWTKGDQAPQGDDPPWVRVEFSIPPCPVDQSPLWWVSAIADPHSALALLQKQGYPIVGHTFLPDHALFSAHLVQQLYRKAQAQGAKVAMTGKDWVKWKLWDSRKSRVQVFEPTLHFLNGQEHWERLLWQHFS